MSVQSLVTRLETIVFKERGAAENFDSHSGGYILSAFFTLLLPALRVILRGLIYQPAGLIILRQRLQKADNKAEKSLLILKWNECCWKATFYMSVVGVGIAAVWNEKFVMDTRYFWIGCTQFPPCNFSVSSLMRLMYSLELGFYVQAVPYLCLWEIRRKDFWENFAHHLATIGLIVYSYQVNFMRIGVMVFLCHDINDIFMEIAKLAKYAEKERLASVLFGCFMVSWFASRMTYFPLWIIRSAYSEPVEIVAKKYNINPHPHYEIFLTLLCFLFALHCYWSYLIVRIAVRQVLQGDVDDIREEPDD